MALHPKKEFAEMCGMKSGDLSNYEKRGKVVYSGDYVDGSLSVNADFLEKHREKKAGKSKEVDEISKNSTIEESKHLTSINVLPPVYPPQKIPDTKIKEPIQKFTKYDFEKEKASLINEKLIQEVEILREKKERIQGVNIPKEPVVLAFSFNFKNFARSIKVGVENLITRYEKNFTPDEFASIRAAIVKEINHAQTVAVAQSKKNIAEIIAMSADKKEAGERE